MMNWGWELQKKAFTIKVWVSDEFPHSAENRCVIAERLQHFGFQQQHVGDPSLI